ncbi:hypothetical protein K437DRAFT_66543 [Tilletiaria anomala UBC 951]|uniref:Uncharacterized protein n=1 Tax=Tilletiaria anomala (strain ATCC 24038 / CBS 436.72 / UBC 951) TaxID=1037660 RepID=A0A066W9L2_TILAU|nr:uncharacterized protein K437DRAFT_66543 [Tilletiaria anomala UBC 951]KDN50401.1 hypothetical protein K437DRAFT_66543 [Tilletiaria anomala UBC 951]
MERRSAKTLVYVKLKMPAKISLRFLGTSSQPSRTRNYSALLLKHDHYAALIDCGEGTQRQILSKHIGGEERVSSLRTIFITHLHVDHVSGIVPLMMSIMGPSGAAAIDPNDQHPRLTIYGPLGLRSLIRATLNLCYAGLNGKYVVHELRWPQQAHKTDDVGSNWSDPDGELLGAINPIRTLPELPPHDSELPGQDIVMSESTCSWSNFTVIGDQGQVSVSAAPILHRCPCLGYVFKEKDRSSPISSEILDRLDANGPALLEQGVKHPRSLLGKLLALRECVELPDGTTIDPPPLDIFGRKICVLGDTFDATAGFFESDKGITPLAMNSNVLVHECTNVALPPKLLQTSGAPPKKVPTREEVQAKAKERGHSTPQVAGAFAGRIKAGQLLLNHFSVRYDSPPAWIQGQELSAVDYELSSAPEKPGGDATVNTGAEQSIPSTGPEVRAPPPFSWVERTARVMQNIEDQATEAWISSLRQWGDGTPDLAHQESQNLQFRAIATYDGFVFDVLTKEEREEKSTKAQVERIIEPQLESSSLASVRGKPTGETYSQSAMAAASGGPIWRQSQGSTQGGRGNEGSSRRVDGSGSRPRGRGHESGSQTA